MGRSGSWQTLADIIRATPQLNGSPQNRCRIIQCVQKLVDQDQRHLATKYHVSASSSLTSINIVSNPAVRIYIDQSTSCLAKTVPSGASSILAMMAISLSSLRGIPVQNTLSRPHLVDFETNIARLPEHQHSETERMGPLRGRLSSTVQRSE